MPPVPVFFASGRPFPPAPCGLTIWAIGPASRSFWPIDFRNRERQFNIMRTIRRKVSRTAVSVLSVFFATTALLAAPQSPETPLAAPPVADKIADHSSPPDTIDLRDYVVLPAVGHYGRLAVQQDSVEAALISGQ